MWTKDDAHQLGLFRARLGRLVSKWGLVCIKQGCSVRRDIWLSSGFKTVVLKRKGGSLEMLLDQSCRGILHRESELVEWGVSMSG